MATLCYNKLSNEFILYHGDNIKPYINYGFDASRYSYIGKLYIPMYSELEICGIDKFYTFDDFFQQKMKGTIYDNWMYPRHNITLHFEDNDNNVRYYPISIKLQDSANDIVYGYNQSKLDILSFFDIDINYFNTMVEFMDEKKYHAIIIKNNIKVYVSPLDDRKMKYSLFKGEPVKKQFQIAWKNRYKTYLNISIPKSYKKILTHDYIGGSDGELFVTMFYDETWPNLFKIEPITYKDNSLIPQITDYDMLSCLSQEQIELKELNELAKRKQEEMHKRQLAENKLKPGYCDVCGSPNATYRANPCIQELQGRTVMEWLCDDCYYDSLGDI